MTAKVPVRAGRHFLQIPGPTNVPDRILRAMDYPTIDHRGPEFNALARKVLRSVRQVFQTRQPVIVYPASAGSADAVFEQGLEAGASDVQSAAETHEIVCAVEDFNAAREALEKSLGAPQSAKLVWRPSTTAPVEQAQAESLFKLIEQLEDNDDVQTVTANFEISDAVLARLTA